MATAIVDPATVTRLVEKGKATRPDLATRLEKAALIVLFRTVELTDPAHHAYRVESEAEAGRFYTVNGVCDCPDYGRRAPGGWCKHRLATALVERAQAERERQDVAAIVAAWEALA